MWGKFYTLSYVNIDKYYTIYIAIELMTYIRGQINIQYK